MAGSKKKSGMFIETPCEIDRGLCGLGILRLRLRMTEFRNGSDHLRMGDFASAGFSSSARILPSSSA